MSISCPGVAAIVIPTGLASGLWAAATVVAMAGRNGPTAAEITNVRRFMLRFSLINIESEVRKRTFTRVRGTSSQPALCNRLRARRLKLRIVGCSAEAALRLRHQIGDEHGKDEQQPDHAGLRVAGDAGDGHTIAQVEHQHDGKNHTDHRTDTTENAHAAEQHDRDDIELESLSGTGAHGSQPGGIEHPGQRRYEPAHGKDDDARPHHRHTGKDGHLAHSSQWYRPGARTRCSAESRRRWRP